MNIIKLGVLELAQKIKDKEVSSHQVVEAFIKQIKSLNHKRVVVEVFEDAYDYAKEVDKNIASGKEERPLAGVPIIIKDNMLYKGHKCTCASNFLKDFVSPYTATVVQKLLDKGAIILGRANMDEFAMGGSNEKSVYGPCLNAWDDAYVSGGSSGGSAVAVAANMCAAALGTDTGGSVRQPSSFNGVVGIKPTYGRVSRYGVVAFASSLDQVGPITKNVKDNAYLLKILAGQDPSDQTTLVEEAGDYLEGLNKDIKGLKIGLCKELMDLSKDTTYYPNFMKAVEFLKNKGAIVDYFSIKDIDLILQLYYIIAPAEAASNLGRFDGVKYTTRSKDAYDIKEVYAKSRTEGFNDEVKLRVMIGNYVLSSENYNDYYLKAKKIQTKIRKAFDKVFESFDLVVLPTTYGEAFKLGDKTQDAVSMYLEDMYTVLANITSLPALSVPYSKGVNNLPLGLQILARPLGESTIYKLASFIEANYREEE